VNKKNAIAFLYFSSIICSCSAATKSCEQEEFSSLLLETSVFKGGLSDIKMSDAIINDVIELKIDKKTAICSGSLTATQTFRDGSTLPFQSDYTWKVEITQDGKNFFSWIEGRQSAADME
jgi:hypothetical protein